MPFEYKQPIPHPDSIREEMPIDLITREIKRRQDEEIRKVFERKSNKFLVVIGPCSAHDENQVCDYTTRLARLQEEVIEKIILIPRIYTNKPRTTGKGYKGMVHQPVATEKPNIVEGLKAIRAMHIRSLKESHLPAADEMLYPNNYPYLDDLLSYVAIGARSVEDQLHRLTVSGMDVPAGMKNPTSGDIDVMMNSVMAAQIPQDFIYNGWEIRTPGNPLAHCILRGAFDQHGQHIPNYHYEDLRDVAEQYLERGLKNPAILVDTNHANSGKQYKQQTRISLEIMRSRQDSDLIKDMVRGLMIESFIVEGAQDMKSEVYGQSITDPCLGWEESESLVRRMADYL